MSSNIKLVLTDLDDTIAPHGGHDISEAVREAIIAVENQGVIVTPVSGRTYSFAKPVLNVLGVSGPCVLDGGATIIDSETGEILWKQWIDVQIVRKVLSVAIPYSKSFIYSTYNHDEIDADMIDVDHINSDAPSILAFIDETREDELKQKLAAIDGLSFYFFLGTIGDSEVRCRAVQVSDINATKHHGVEALREIRHIPKEQTLAIGDGDNDLPLFESAGIKIAVGNATEKLKAAADDIVGTQEEDGFVEAMNKYVLNK